MKKKNFFKYIGKYSPVLVFAIAALFLSVYLDLRYPKIQQSLVDDVLVGGKMDMLKPVLLGILTIGVGRMLLQYAKEFSFDWTSAHIATGIRRDLFLHIQSLDTSFFDKTNTGEIMSRLHEDINNIWNVFSYIGMLLIEVTVHTVIIIIAMFKLNPVITIIPCVAMLYCGILAIVLEKKLDKVYEDISEENALLNTTVEENIAGVRTVKAFARERHEISKFGIHNSKYSDCCFIETKTFAKYYPYFSFVTRILPFAVLIAGGFYYVKGSMTLGEVTAFVAYSNNIVWPMEMLGWLTNSFAAGIASNKKIQKIYKEQAKIFDAENPVILPEVQGNIEFNHVSFHKEDMHEILSDIDFKLEKGKTLGIMGATGSGKSSIISVLERLYDVTDGSICIDGVNVKDMSVKQLRGNISLVMQDVFLFSDTISENVKIGMKDTITDEDVMRACKEAGAYEFIEKMEDKYETVIGERGVGLSGGQKQRISMARAFAKHNPILVLDDSTSALDMETEKEVQKNLSKLKDCTKIIIAHRISSVKQADEILFLDGGKIAERGTHEELLKKKGLYYETYVSQYGEPV